MAKTKTKGTAKTVSDTPVPQPITISSTNPKIMADNIKKLEKAIKGADDASEISYDNTTSGLTAENVQAAIDEVATGLSGLEASDVAYDNTGSGLTAATVQAAIDEINAYEWVSIGNAGIGTEISLSNADYKEYFVSAVFGENPTISINFFIPKGNLLSSPLHYISGSMATSQYGMQVELEATTSYIKLVSIYRNGESISTGKIYVSGKYPA